MFTEQQNKDFAIAQAIYENKYSDLLVEYDEDEEDNEWMFDEDREYYEYDK